MSIVLVLKSMSAEDTLKFLSAISENMPHARSVNNSSKNIHYPKLIIKIKFRKMSFFYELHEYV